MPITQDVIALNDYGVERRDRTSAKGVTKSRYTVSIRSEPLLHQFDSLRLGKGPAEAIAEHLRQRIRGITEYASPATILRRQQAKVAFDAGKPWALQRYSGGRTGATPPKTGASRLFNDSDRLSNSLIAMENKQEKAWTINIAANRFDPSSFNGGEMALLQMIERLQRIIPEFGSAAELAKVKSVQDAISQSIADLIVDAKRQNRALRTQLVRSVLGTAQSAVGLGG